MFEGSWILGLGLVELISDPGKLSTEIFPVGMDRKDLWIGWNSAESLMPKISKDSKSYESQDLNITDVLICWLASKQISEFADNPRSKTNQESKNRHVIWKKNVII